MQKYNCPCTSVYIYLTQVLEPDKRLGSEETGGFEKLKSHPFFKGINWENLENTKPPELVPYLPATSSNPESCWSTMKVSYCSSRVRDLL